VLGATQAVLHHAVQQAVLYHFKQYNTHILCQHRLHAATHSPTSTPSRAQAAAVKSLARFQPHVAPTNSICIVIQAPRCLQYLRGVKKKQIEFQSTLLAAAAAAAGLA
jgi:hypothetical protein